MYPPSMDEFSYCDGHCLVSNFLTECNALHSARSTNEYGISSILCLLRPAGSASGLSLPYSVILIGFDIRGPQRTITGEEYPYIVDR